MNRRRGRGDNGESSDEEATGDGDADTARLSRRHKDDVADYEGEEEEIALKEKVGIQENDEIEVQDNVVDHEVGKEKGDNEEEVDSEEEDGSVEERKPAVVDVNKESDRISVGFLLESNRIVNIFNVFRMLLNPMDEFATISTILSMIAGALSSMSCH